MIDNYLEYVKTCREVDLGMARWAMKQKSPCEYGYAKGFYTGLQHAYNQAASDWKALQKDIEARLDNCQTITAVSSFRDEYDDVLV